jgi:hypothetical protein
MLLQGFEKVSPVEGDAKVSYLAGVPCNIVPLSPTIHTSSAELPHTALKYVDDVAGAWASDHLVPL